jgi:diguanylate cyclase (GGDEF)-like protein
MVPADGSPIDNSHDRIGSIVPLPFSNGSGAVPRGPGVSGSIALPVSPDQELERMWEELLLANQEIGELKTKQQAMEQSIRVLIQMASTDELTGLRNRRRFDEDMESACAMATRHLTPVSVIVLDIDHFKYYNDSFGHIAGDEILCIFASILTRTSRRYDVVARFGGEEFTVLLPSTGSGPAREIAERQREALEAFDWPLRRVTASFGVATMESAAMPRIKLLDQADQALYQAKGMGRNRVTHFADLQFDESRAPRVGSPLPDRSLIITPSAFRQVIARSGLSAVEG